MLILLRSALSASITPANLLLSEFLTRGAFLSINSTVHLSIFKLTVPLLNFSSAFSPPRKVSPKFKSWDRFLTTIGAITIGLSMFSKIMKKGSDLPITCTVCPETAVTAWSEHGVIDKFNLFARFSEQMVPNKFPLSTSVFINVLLIRVRVYPMVHDLTHLGYSRTGVVCGASDL